MPHGGTGPAMTEGFPEFAAREWPRLVGTLDLLCGSPEVAEELAQETLVRAYERWPTVANLESPGGWAHRVAVNLARSQLRRRFAEQRAHQRLQRDAEPGVAVTEPATSAIRQAVSRLPPKLRVAVVLRYFAELSANEAAAVLGISPAALRTRTHRGLALLRSQVPLDDADPDEARRADVHGDARTALAKRQTDG